MTDAACPVGRGEKKCEKLDQPQPNLTLSLFSCRPYQELKTLLGEALSEFDLIPRRKRFTYWLTVKFPSVINALHAKTVLTKARPRWAVDWSHPQHLSPPAGTDKFTLFLGNLNPNSACQDSKPFRQFPFWSLFHSICFSSCYHWGKSERRVESNPSPLNFC